MPDHGELVPRCGYKPHGYLGCTRELGHEGPCAHKLDPAIGVDPGSVVVDLESVATDFESTPERLEELYWETFEAMFGKRGKA